MPRTRIASSRYVIASRAGATKATSAELAQLSATRSGRSSRTSRRVIQRGELIHRSLGALYGSEAMRALRSFTVRPVLPPALSPLHDLAMNLRWSWDERTRDLFRWVDPDVWQHTGHDPVRL